MSMKPLDRQVIEQGVQWLEEGGSLWLCTVLATFGSSPREPGSMMVARSDGRHVGSLSGGCVEEDFLERLGQGEFDQPISVLRYGDENEGNRPRVRLPCGGILEVLVERLEPRASTRAHLQAILASMAGQRDLERQVELSSGKVSLESTGRLEGRVERTRDGGSVRIRIGPVARLIIAGVSPVSEVCARFAQTLGFEVIVCDPRDGVGAVFEDSGVEFQAILPSLFIVSEGVCHDATAIVALTHDPRIDDLAMMAAVKTPAFYIGVMGSQRTSQARAARLARSGGLSPAQIERIHMPIGMALGSKTPAEIALAVMADIVRVRQGGAASQERERPGIDPVSGREARGTETA